MNTVEEMLADGISPDNDFTLDPRLGESLTQQLINSINDTVSIQSLAANLLIKYDREDSIPQKRNKSPFFFTRLKETHFFPLKKPADQLVKDYLREFRRNVLEWYMVTLDRTFLSMCADIVKRQDLAVRYPRLLNLNVIARMQNAIFLWSFPTKSMVIAMDLLPDLQAGDVLSTHFDPASRLEILKTGRIGTLFGMDTLTDGFREPCLRAVEPGDVWVFADPMLLGWCVLNGGVRQEPLEDGDDGPGIRFSFSVDLALLDHPTTSAADGDDLEPKVTIMRATRETAEQRKDRLRTILPPPRLSLEVNTGEDCFSFPVKIRS